VTALPGLCTREDVADALDVAPSVGAHRSIDRWVQAARVSVENLCHRSSFHPVVATRSWSAPSREQRSSWRLWLDEHPLISLDTLTTGGRVIDPADYFLEPQRSGPPYTCVELDLGGAGVAGWGGGSTPQRAIDLAGVWGWSADTEPAGDLAAGVDAVAVQLQVTDAAAVGVGDLIAVGSERMVITERGWLTTGQTLQAPVAALVNATALTVTDGSAFRVGEQLLLDAETVAVDGVAGNTLVVRRAVAGSVLAGHTGSTLYASRLLTVARGAAGTTAAAHDAGADVGRWMPPPLTTDLAIAEVIVGIGREQSGMARTIGSGEGVRAAPGGDLADLRARVRARYGRKARMQAV
jgi:hypothetical protein